MEEDTPINASVSKKMTDWTDEPSLSVLKKDFEEARQSKDTHVQRVHRWRENLAVEGSAVPKVPDGQSKVVPKLIRKQAEWRYPSLSYPFLSTPDMFTVEPRTWEDKESAHQNGLLLNQQFNTAIDKTSFTDEYVRAVVDEGTVIARVGWEFEEEEYEEAVPVYEFYENPELMPMMQELDAMEADNPTGYEHEVEEELREAHQMYKDTGIPHEVTVVGAEEQTLTRTLKNQPTLEICEIDDVVVDPTCKGNTDKANFIIHSFHSSLSELTKDGRYQRLDEINLQNSTILGEPDEGTDNTSSYNPSDKARQKFTVHEYWGFWDIDGNNLVKPIVAAWVGDTLIRLEENPFPDKKPPFVMVPYLPIKKSVYGEPDGELLEDNQKIMGAVTRGMIDIMGKSANGQTAMRKDMLDLGNKRKFEKGMDYEFNAGVDPRQGIHQHTYPEIPQSAQFMLQQQSMDAESLSGVKAFSNGISGDSLGTTATGQRGAMDASSKRELDILRRLSNGMIKIGRKIISMNQEFLSEEEVVRVTNDEFIPVRRDDLQGNIDLRLSVSTAEEDDSKAQELAFMLQTVGPNVDPTVTFMIMSDIARLRKMPELEKRLKEYEPKPDPMQQKMQQLEMEKLLSEIELNKAKTQETMADSQEAAAKAKNISADTDKKSLDFVEQESGVTQERNLQKVGEQARSQQQLKAMDHQFKMQEDRKKALRDYLEKDAKAS